ncbi:Uu.00g119820.m01.CDS01 [Anthostomella pinea]|uniref:Uu.00g119820.m01.CDS01 n=1 Tax=Anthostomella pinea TaxID=933095 RepID=A0AAI8YER3_9PEZI|nr:Uu.00g119820.m01.CDS01 [Anthostomella pinea]
MRSPIGDQEILAILRDQGGSKGRLMAPACGAYHESQRTETKAAQALPPLPPLPQQKDESVKKDEPKAKYQLALIGVEPKSTLTKKSNKRVKTTHQAPTFSMPTGSRLPSRGSTPIISAFLKGLTGHVPDSVESPLARKTRRNL